MAADLYRTASELYRQVRVGLQAAMEGGFAEARLVELRMLGRGWLAGLSLAAEPVAAGQVAGEMVAAL